MQKLLLVILDGFGLNFDQRSNPVLTTQTPTLDNLIANYPFTSLQASGEEVGLSWGEVGNSEVGHFNLGAGQILWQNLPKIDKAIEQGELARNKAVNDVFKNVKKNNSSLHLVGLVSDGGIHSHIRHLINIVKEAKNSGLEKVFVQMISDGRDSPPKNALKYIQKLEREFQTIGIGVISTISGRAYAMDRDNNWENTEEFYKTITGQKGKKYQSASELIQDGYNQGLDDEKISPGIIDLETEAQFIRDNDGVIIFNFRADRSRQMTKAIGDPNLTDFSRKYYPQNVDLATMTPYEEDWKMEIQTIFNPPKVEYACPLLISDQNLSQYHTTESEKAAHVTYFFNGGHQQKYPLEENKIFKSPNVSSYAKKPEMNLKSVINNLIKVMNKDQYNFCLLNIANPDIVGHTGDFRAAQKAIAHTDSALESLLLAASKAGYVSLVTADHGNVEQMINPTTGQPDKEHTVNPVPFIWVENYQRNRQKYDTLALWQEISQLSPTGILVDVSATCLNQLEVAIPEFMAGEELSEALVKF